MNAASAAASFRGFGCSGSGSDHLELRVIMSLLERVQTGALRTRELRELLEDEDKISLMIRCSEKFQRLQHSIEIFKVSNQKRAKSNLSQKPKFRDAKLLLGIKYKELEKLRSVIWAKQEQLAEINSVHRALMSLLQKINHTDEDSEMLFQRFAEGKTALEEFLDSCLVSRKLHHMRLVLVRKLQEIIRHEEKTTQIHPTYSLTTAACCHPLLMLPLCTLSHPGVCLHQSPFGFEHMHSDGYRWPARPVRLQPLKMQQRRHQQ